MEEIICPNCKEKFKADLSKKYYNCPHCRHEFANPEMTRNQLGSEPDKGLSLAEKIKRAKQSI